MVLVRSSKLSESAFATLIEDLETRLPASLAICLDRLGAATDVAETAPRDGTLAEEWERVRRALAGVPGHPGLIETLTRIAGDPHGVLSTEEQWVRTDIARHPSMPRLGEALAKPGNLLLDGSPLKIVDTRVVHSFDVYENRLVREFRDQARLRLRRLRAWAAWAPEFARHVGAELGSLSERFDAAWRAAAFLNGVAPLKVPPRRLTMVLLRRPDYRAALNGYLSFRKGLQARIEHPALDAPLQAIPTLYEVWCTLIVLERLLQMGAERGFEVTHQALWRMGQSAPFVTLLSPGRPLVSLRSANGSEITLTAQREYAAAAGGGLGSVSFKQIPDVTLEVKTGACRQLYLFDPKYKLFADSEGLPSDGGPRKEDIDKMHAYRDAIRDQSGTRIVAFAGILYPGGVTAARGGVGALPLVPGDASVHPALDAVLAEAYEVARTGKPVPPHELGSFYG
jgi:hypothetical protein